MYWLTNSLKNLYRSRRRYIPLAVMYFILVCGADADIYGCINPAFPPA